MTTTMSDELLKVLEKGLSKLERHISSCKSPLQQRLLEGQKITEEDTAWLDNGANFIDETATISFLKDHPTMDFICSSKTFSDYT